jgi:1-acyl-sn-glycerol-3-phosphate acyltransferase
MQKKSFSILQFACYINILPVTCVYLHKIYLCFMILEIRNRFSIGPVIGVSIFNPDENHDYAELVFHLIFIELAFIW